MVRRQNARGLGLLVAAGGCLWAVGCALSPIPELPHDDGGIGGGSSAGGSAPGAGGVSEAGAAGSDGTPASGGGPDSLGGGGEAPLLGGQGGEADR